MLILTTESKGNTLAKGPPAQRAESIDENGAAAAVCRKVSKSISTFVEAGTNKGGSRGLNHWRWIET